MLKILKLTEMNGDLENQATDFNAVSLSGARPENRPSVGMRYGDMRSKLQQAAMLRAQRRQERQDVHLHHPDHSAPYSHVCRVVGFEKCSERP